MILLLITLKLGFVRKIQLLFFEMRWWTFNEKLIIGECKVLVINCLKGIVLSADFLIKLKKVEQSVFLEFKFRITIDEFWKMLIFSDCS